MSDLRGIVPGTPVLPSETIEIVLLKPWESNEVQAVAEWYFADRALAWAWWTSPNKRLGNLSPREWVELGLEAELRMYMNRVMRVPHF